MFTALQWKFGKSEITATREQRLGKAGGDGLRRQRNG
jgi:hypothetical protein